MKRWISKVKQLKTILSALAIAVALLAANTACTSEGADNTVPEQPQQPDMPPTGGITITVGAGINDDGAPSRSIVAIEDGKRALHFTDGDKLYVYGNLPYGYYLVGTLDIDASSISASGKSANFSGTIKVYDSDNKDVTDTYHFSDPSDPLADCTSATAHLFHKDMKADIYTIQANHTLVYNTANAFAADVETLMTTVLKVSGDYDKSHKKFSLGSTDAILNCTLSGLAASTSYKVKLNSNSSPVATYDFSTDANGIGTIAFVSSVGSYARILNILQSDGTTLVGDIDLGTHNFTAKVYNVMRNWLNPDFRTPTDLATVATPYTAKNGEILTGKLGGGAANTGNVKIEAGATVVLHNVEITSVNTDGGKQYAGIDCEGNATIILSGTNKVKGGASNRSAIYIPKDKTLTLRGSGLLEATGTENGAAIGGGYNYTNHDDCGNIVIEGGHISAAAGAQKVLPSVVVTPSLVAPSPYRAAPSQPVLLVRVQVGVRRLAAVTPALVVLSVLVEALSPPLQAPGARRLAADIILSLAVPSISVAETLRLPQQVLVLASVVGRAVIALVLASRAAQSKHRVLLVQALAAEVTLVLLVVPSPSPVV